MLIWQTKTIAAWKMLWKPAFSRQRPYPEDIPDVANYLGKVIEERAKVCPQNKLSILACTNKNHYIDDVCSCFRQALQTEEARAWFDSNAVVRDCIVRRSTNAESSHALSLVSTVCMTLLVQQPIFCGYL